MQRYLNISARDRVLQKTPVSFDEPDQHRDTGYLVSLIQEQQVTVVRFVPSMLQAFLDERDVSSCRSLRHVVCSGEVLPPGLRDNTLRLLPARLHNLYGPTEAAIDVTAWECTDVGGVVPIGRPVCGVRCVVVDRYGGVAPAGVVGELVVGGVGLARGYVGRSGLTAQRFVAGVGGGRWYRTGDLVRWDTDGALRFVGRVDRQVKVRGVRVEPGEVEVVLVSHPRVRECVVVAGAVGLVAYLVPAGSSVPVEAVRRFVRGVLPEVLVPAVFEVVDGLPVTGTGKVDRRRLAAVSVRVGTGGVGPRTPTERVVAGVWAAVLGRPPGGVGGSALVVGADR